MKKIFISICICALTLSSQAQNYFQASVKKNGTSLEFYLRLLPGGSNVSIRFDDINFQIRWPIGDVAPITGLITVNAIDFPGLLILDDPYGFEGYGNEPGYTIKQFTPQAPGSVTNAIRAYTAGQEYLVFSVAVSNAISPNIQLAGNNEDVLSPYYFSITKNSPGLGQSDYTSHNPVNGNIANQFFYATPATLLTSSPGAGGTTNFYQTIVTGAPVPVRFSSFSAVKKDNDALLNFTVQNETAVTDRYEVERSVDGYKFDKIRSLAKANNGNSNNTYDVVDPNLSSIKNAGIIYYRIKQLDIDGALAYTDIKYVRMSDKGGLISAYPNPAKEFTILKLDAVEAGDINIMLINAEGRQFQTTLLKAQKGINIKRIEMSNLPAGSYLIKAIIAGETKTISVIKL